MIPLQHGPSLRLQAATPLLPWLGCLLGYEGDTVRQGWWQPLLSSVLRPSCTRDQGPQQPAHGGRSGSSVLPPAGSLEVKLSERCQAFPGKALLRAQTSCRPLTQTL